ncbi:MAG: methyltransferase domain-containing protein [Minisyncoccia bacterium]
MKFINYCRSCNSIDCNTNPAILAPFLTERIFDIKPETTTTLYGLPNQINYFPCKTITCKTCGFVGINILFDKDEMSNLYREYRSDDYNRTRLFYEPTYKNNIFASRHKYVDDVSQPFILKHVSDIYTLIDYGGYDGLNTPRIGNERYVYDICEVESIIPIVHSLFPCDLITCMHVLEHVPDPNEILSEIKGSGKYYYFEVPNENVKNKEFWHEHINCFTMKSILHLLSRYFKIIASKEELYLHVLCEDIR